MKKILLFFLVITICLTASNAFGFLDDSSKKNAETAARASTDTNKKVTGFQKTIDDIKEGFTNFKKDIVAAIVAIFVYVTAVLIKLFYMLFTFTGEVLHRYLNFSESSFWPDPYNKAFNHAVALFYLVAAGFTLIAVLASIMKKLSTGQNPAKAIVDLSFAILALAFFPLIYKLIFTVIGQFSNALFDIYNSSPSKENIFNSMINVTSYLKNVDPDPIVPKILGGSFTEKSIMDLDSVMTICRENLDNGNVLFFINQFLIFMVTFGGIIACLEAILLKGAQLLNLCIAYFTGIFACGTLSNPEMSNTFFQWILKYVQLLSYNVFWALLLLIINMMGAKLKTNISSTDQILYLIIILAALRTLPKVGGIAEGLMMSSGIMQNFSQAAKYDAMGSVVAISSGISATKSIYDVARDKTTGIRQGVGSKINSAGANLLNKINPYGKNLLQGPGGQARPLGNPGAGGGSGKRTINVQAPRTSRAMNSPNIGPVSGKTREQWQAQRPKRST